MAEEPKYNPETVRTVLNILQKEFEAEEGRNKYIITKVQMMLTVAGILLAAITFLLKTISENGWLISLNTTLLSLAALIIVISIIIFLKVIQIRLFKRIKSEALVFNSELEKKPVEVESRLITTYEEALKDNRLTVDDMADKFRKGTFFVMISSFIVFLVLFTIFWINTRNLCLWR
ncbi:MAG: hypothetical protein M1508_13325 [Nitrospirae bacterium]|nr:hypothetical protein [Nitrospirota bacterium]MCL5423030.1 hypothetical protein [Nitrospirota bacterium]